MMTEGDLVRTILATQGKILAFVPGVRLLFQPADDGADVVQFARNCGWQPVSFGSNGAYEVDLLARKPVQDLDTLP